MQTQAMRLHALLSLSLYRRYAWYVGVKADHRAVRSDLGAKKKKMQKLLSTASTLRSTRTTYTLADLAQSDETALVITPLQSVQPGWRHGGLVGL